MSKFKEKMGDVGLFFKQMGHIAAVTAHDYFQEVTPGATSIYDEIVSTPDQLEDYFTSTNQDIVKTVKSYKRLPIFKDFGNWFLGKYTDYDDTEDEEERDWSSSDGAQFKSEPSSQEQLTAQISESQRSANQVSKSIFEATSKLVDSNITALSAQKELIVKETSAITTGFKTVTEKLDKILEVMTKNTGIIISDNRLRSNEDNDNSYATFMESTEFDAGAYKDILVKNFNSIIDNIPGLSEFKSFAESGVLKSMLNDPAQLFSQGFKMMMADSETNQKLELLGEKLDNFLKGGVIELGAHAGKDGFLGFLGDLLGINSSKQKIETKRDSIKTGPTSWDGISREALTNTIPGYLRKILVQLGGKDEIYDYRSRKFITQKALEKEFRDLSSNSITAGFNGLNTSYDIRKLFEDVNSNEYNSMNAFYSLIKAQLGELTPSQRLEEIKNLKNKDSVDNLLSKTLDKYDLSEDDLASYDKFKEKMAQVVGDNGNVKSLLHEIGLDEVSRSSILRRHLESLNEYNMDVSMMDDNIKSQTKGILTAYDFNRKKKTKGENALESPTFDKSAPLITSQDAYTHKALYQIFSILNRGINVYVRGSDNTRSQAYEDISTSLEQPIDVTKIKEIKTTEGGNKKIDQKTLDENKKKFDERMKKDGEKAKLSDQLFGEGKVGVEGVIDAIKSGDPAKAGAVLMSTVQNMGTVGMTHAAQKADPIISEVKNIANSMKHTFTGKGYKEVTYEDDGTGNLVKKEVEIADNEKGGLLGKLKDDLVGGGNYLGNKGKEIAQSFKSAITQGEYGAKEGEDGEEGGSSGSTLSKGLKSISREAKGKIAAATVGAFLVGSSVPIIGGPVAALVASIATAGLGISSTVNSKVHDALFGRETEGKNKGKPTGVISKLHDSIVLPVQFYTKKTTDFFTHIIKREGHDMLFKLTSVFNKRTIEHVDTGWGRFWKIHFPKAMKKTGEWLKDTLKDIGGILKRPFVLLGKGIANIAKTIYNSKIGQFVKDKIAKPTWNLIKTAGSAVGAGITKFIAHPFVNSVVFFAGIGDYKILAEGEEYWLLPGQKYLDPLKEKNDKDEMIKNDEDPKTYDRRKAVRTFSGERNDLLLLPRVGTQNYFMEKIPEDAKLPKRMKKKYSEGIKIIGSKTDKYIIRPHVKDYIKQKANYARETEDKLYRENKVRLKDFKAAKRAGYAGSAKDYITQKVREEQNTENTQEIKDNTKDINEQVGELLKTTQEDAKQTQEKLGEITGEIEHNGNHCFKVLDKLTHIRLDKIIELLGGNPVDDSTSDAEMINAPAKDPENELSDIEDNKHDKAVEMGSAAIGAATQDNELSDKESNSLENITQEIAKDKPNPEKVASEQTNILRGMKEKSETKKSSIWEMISGALTGGLGGLGSLFNGSGFASFLSALPALGLVATFLMKLINDPTGAAKNISSFASGFMNFVNGDSDVATNATSALFDMQYENAIDPYIPSEVYHNETDAAGNNISNSAATAAHNSRWEYVGKKALWEYGKNNTSARNYKGAKVVLPEKTGNYQIDSRNAETARYQQRYEDLKAEAQRRRDIKSGTKDKNAAKGAAKNFATFAGQRTMTGGLALGAGAAADWTTSSILQGIGMEEEEAKKGGRLANSIASNAVFANDALHAANWNKSWAGKAFNKIKTSATTKGGMLNDMGNDLKIVGGQLSKFGEWLKSAFEAIAKAFGKLTKLKGFKWLGKFVNWLKGIGGKFASKLSEKVLSKFMPKITAKVGSGALKEAFNDITAAFTGPIGAMVGGALGAIGGMLSVEHLFGIPAGDATPEMTTVSSLYQAAIGALNMTPGCAIIMCIWDIANEIFAFCNINNGYTIDQTIAQTLYRNMFGDEKLDELQGKNQAMLDKYNQENNKDLTMQEWIDMTTDTGMATFIKGKARQTADGTGYETNDANEILKYGGLNSGFGMFGINKRHAKDAEGNLLVDENGNYIEAKDEYGNSIKEDSTLFDKVWMANKKAFMDTLGISRNLVDENGQAILDENGNEIKVKNKNFFERLFTGDWNNESSEIISTSNVSTNAEIIGTGGGAESYEDSAEIVGSSSETDEDGNRITTSINPDGSQHMLITTPNGMTYSVDVDKDGKYSISTEDENGTQGLSEFVSSSAVQTINPIVASIIDLKDGIENWSNNESPWAQEKMDSTTWITQKIQAFYDEILQPVNDLIDQTSIMGELHGTNSSSTTTSSISYSNSSAVSEGNSTARKGDDVTLPSGLGTSNTYMAWQAITAKGTKQWDLREQSGMNFDSNGYAKVNGRYVIAMTNTFGDVGDYVDVYREDGTVLKAIIGDIKDQTTAHGTPANKWGHDNGKSVVEFITDRNTVKDQSQIYSSDPGKFRSPVTHVQNMGSYFNGDAVGGGPELFDDNPNTKNPFNNKIGFGSGEEDIDPTHVTREVGGPGGIRQIFDLGKPSFGTPKSSEDIGLGSPMAANTSKLRRDGTWGGEWMGKSGPFSGDIENKSPLTVKAAKPGANGVWGSAGSSPGLTRNHGGIDIGPESGQVEGSPIVAAYPGVVSTIQRNVNGYSEDKSYAGGNYVIYDADNGYRVTSYHMRNNSIPGSLKVGDRVKPGDILGKLGNTGHSTGPHLHYSLQPPATHSGGPTVGNTMDPWPIVKAAQEGQEGLLSGSRYSGYSSDGTTTTTDGTTTSTTENQGPLAQLISGITSFGSSLLNALTGGLFGNNTSESASVNSDVTSDGYSSSSADGSYSALGGSKTSLTNVYIPAKHQYNDRSNVNRITIHQMGAYWTAEECAKYFANPERVCGANYTVGYDGSIALCIPEDKRSACSSNTNNDKHAITIEVSNSKKNSEEVNDTALNATINLCIDICKRYNKKKMVYFNSKSEAESYSLKSDEMLLTRHDFYSNKSCPGPYLGAKFPYIVQRVNEVLNRSGANTENASDRFKISEQYTTAYNVANSVSSISKVLNQPSTPKEAQALKQQTIRDDFERQASRFKDNNGCGPENRIGLGGDSFNSSTSSISSHRNYSNNIRPNTIKSITPSSINKFNSRSSMPSSTYNSTSSSLPKNYPYTSSTSNTKSSNINGGNIDNVIYVLNTMLNELTAIRNNTGSSTSLLSDIKEANKEIQTNNTRRSSSRKSRLPKSSNSSAALALARP